MIPLSDQWLEHRKFRELLKVAYNNPDLLNQKHELPNNTKISMHEDYYKLETSIPLELQILLRGDNSSQFLVNGFKAVTYACFEKHRSLSGCESHVYALNGLNKNNEVWMAKYSGLGRFNAFNIHSEAINEAEKYRNLLDLLTTDSHVQTSSREQVA